MANVRILTDGGAMRKRSRGTLSFLAWFWLGAVLAISVDARGQEPALPPRDPAVAPILQVLGEYCSQLRKDFHNYIAEERDTQKVYKRSGELDRERHILADYYLVSPPSAPTEQVDFREVLEVDGKKVGRSRDALLKLLTQPGADLGKEAERLKKESNRYELLGGSKALSSVALLLPMYGLPENQSHTEYSLAGEQPAPDQWAVDFHEVGDMTLLSRGQPRHSREPLPASGRFYLAKPDGRILRADVSVNIREEDGTTTKLRYVVEYQPGKDRRMLPSRRLMFLNNPQWRHGPVAESEANYSNFRQFSAHSSIVSSEDP